MTKQGDSALDRAVAMVADLRARCDWDRIQTRQTLRPYLIEEAHELSAALASGESGAIRDEVSDLMLHLAWQLVLGAELREFTAEDVADDLVTKMRRRHPHLFNLGDREQWENLKARERVPGVGVLSGLPATLPELLMSYRLQERAAGVGFDWPDTVGPLAKVHEELAEVEAEMISNATTTDALEEELGDLLFAVVNLARKAGIQPGLALDRANLKFRRRFEAIEELAAARQLSLPTMTLEEMDLLWDEIKQEEMGDRRSEKPEPRISDL